MKTSVTRIMMSFALMGCLIIGASDASAQGRSRSQGGSSSSRSHSAAVSRSSSSAAPQVSRSSSSSSRSSATPQVSRSSSSSSRSSATPQVSRSSSSSSRSSATPQVGRSSTSSSRSSATPQVGRSGSGSSRSGHSATTRGGDNRGGSGNSGSSGSVTRHSDSKPQVSHQGTTQRVDRSTHNGSETRLGDRDRRGNRPGGNTGNGNHGNGNHGNGNHGNGNHGNGNHGNMGNGNHGNGNHGNGGNHPEGNRPPSNRPGGHGGHGGHGDNHGHGGHHGYNPDHRFDYSSHHYRDQFSWNHSHHNWSRPLPPPARRYRPAPLIWRRPVIPAGWHPYAGAPIIDRVLGLVFGTLYEVSLDQLYYNGYYIDGYADNVIYLRDVTMLNLYWPDVMLSYEYGKLANAQFVYHSSYYDRTRFNRAYNSLCRIYGSPVYQDGMTISWYGGNSTGWVTLTMTDSYGDYYTTMSIGY